MAGPHLRWSGQHSDSTFAQCRHVCSRYVQTVHVLRSFMQHAGHSRSPQLQHIPKACCPSNDEAGRGNSLHAYMPAWLQAVPSPVDVSLKAKSQRPAEVLSQHVMQPVGLCRWT